MDLFLIIKLKFTSQILFLIQNIMLIIFLFILKLIITQFNLLCYYFKIIFC